MKNLMSMLLIAAGLAMSFTASDRGGHASAPKKKEETCESRTCGDEFKPSIESLLIANEEGQCTAAEASSPLERESEDKPVIRPTHLSSLHMGTRPCEL